MTLYIAYMYSYLWSAGVESEFVSNDEVLGEKKSWEKLQWNQFYQHLLMLESRNR